MIPCAPWRSASSNAGAICSGLRTSSDAHRARRDLDLPPGPGGGGVAEIRVRRDARHLRHQRLQQLEAPRHQLGGIAGEPGHVAARTRQAGHEAGFHRIAHRGHDDRDGRGDAPRGLRRRRAARQDQVDFLAHQLGGERAEALRVSLGRAVEQHQARAFDVAALLHALAEAVHVLRVEVQRRGLEHADAMRLARLAACHERRDRAGRGQQHQSAA
jgi:hypothetical protein